MAKVEKKSGVLFVRVPPALLKKLDAKVAKQKSQGNDSESRGSFTRRALYQALDPEKP